MPAQSGFKRLTPDLVTWWSHLPDARVNGHSHALLHEGRLVLIDPLRPKDPAQWKQILALGQPNLIILTNGNHERDSRQLRAELKLPCASTAAALPHLAQKPDIILDGQPRLQGLRITPMPGAGPGEIALFSQETQTLILGDAVTNLPGAGPALLPPKYRTPPDTLSESLKKLLEFSFTRCLLAHGDPLETGARTTLKKLLATP